MLALLPLLLALPLVKGVFFSLLFLAFSQSRELAEVKLTLLLARSLPSRPAFLSLSFSLSSLLDPSSQQLDLSWKQHRQLDDLPGRCIALQRFRGRKKCLHPQRCLRSCSDGRELVGNEGFCSSSCGSLR